MYRNSDARERVLRRLLERGPSTVEELARDLGVVPVTMRSHLTALQEQGLVAGADERGHVGRPRRRFSLTRQAEALLPSRAGGLSADLLDSLQTLAGGRGVDQLLDVAASRYVTRHAAQMAGCRNLQEHVAAATEVLDQESGLARWEEAGDRFLIRDFHCPYAELARERPAICGYHTQVVTRLLGATVTLERSIARGDAHCVFAVAQHPLQRPAAVRTLSDGRLAPERSYADGEVLRGQRGPTGPSRRRSC
ncbi:MAG: helix-turn-helix transcriptional regulator [Chloroflexota bacterium]